MNNNQLKWETKANPMYRFLLLLTIATAAGFQGWRTLFNNFSVDEIGLNGLDVGAIQSFREVPGFMALLVIFLLFLIREHKLSALSVITMGLGILMTGFFPTFWGMVLTTVIMSVGFHYFETTNQSLTLQYFNKEQTPHVFARFKSITAMTNIVVGGAIYGLSYVLSYQVLYLLIGGFALFAGVFAYLQNPVKEEAEVQHKRMVLRRRYWLFYVLNFLSGARRQIFVVFAVFLLVQKYQYSIQEIAVLFILNNIITYFFNPLIGKAINRYGEKKVLTTEYLGLIVIFLSYAFVENRWIVAGLYLLDHIFFNFSIGIKTYFQKHADPKDIAPSMAVGFTINHIAAVVIPVIGGAFWLVNWQLPFFAGVALSVMSLVFVSKMENK
ncbi:MFS transporter [Algivirga pacifica]|uniref:MFS transporter n=1 Tax=Algivirga pacifica TaxID=1162670 RepID=A0ABP9D8K5_9BACT